MRFLERCIYLNHAFTLIKKVTFVIFQVLAMILGLAVAQDPNYHGRNYQQDDGHQADSRRPTSTTPIPILHWNKQQEHDGTYKIGYHI